MPTGGRQRNAMSDDAIKLQVDGREVEAKRGEMLIAVTDRIDAYVPRFCYHEKLSIAANCRMCLVEVEKAPKPMPACATPVADGMKVFTRSPKAIAAQKATMEFLLINHPLDCPICDQGGECELQDLAMGYGRDVSRYTDRKRVVSDHDIGPLISTDMTRCIHCTRCVRFGEEISGVQELGTTDRGEDMRIATYLNSSVDHELSGNVIDLCPVGALNNKPYRFSARAWEMVQRPTVSPHDCVGTNLYAHVLRGTVKRVVPRPNEAINETWIADRDRYSYEAVYSADRLLRPAVRGTDGQWHDADWDEALEKAATLLRDAGAGAGMLVSPMATLEECHLVAGIADTLGSANLDSRIGRSDFTDQENDPAVPGLGYPIAELEESDAVLLVGSSLRQEAPLLAHRLRKAALGGCQIGIVNDRHDTYYFDTIQITGELLDELAAIASALKLAPSSLPDALGKRVSKAKPGDAHKAIAAALTDAGRASVLVGLGAERHPGFSAVRALAAGIAAETGSELGFVTLGANSAGAAMAGVLPHRAAGGQPRETAGLTATGMFESPLDAYLLLHVEPDADLVAANAAATIRESGGGIALTSFDSEALRDSASVLLPVGTFAETAGSYVNVAGTLQTFQGVASPVGESRPAWKVLRVLATLLDENAPPFNSADEVLAAALIATGEPTIDAGVGTTREVNDEAANGGAARLHTPIYEVDSLVRRATALQRTASGVAGRRERRGSDA